MLPAIAVVRVWSAFCYRRSLCSWRWPFLQVPRPFHRRRRSPPTPSSPFTLETVDFHLDLDGVRHEPRLGSRQRRLLRRRHERASASKSFSRPPASTPSACASSGPAGPASSLSSSLIANRPPVAAMVQFPQAPVTDDPVSFVSTSRDPDGALVSQAWDLDNDGVFDDAQRRAGVVLLPRAGPVHRAAARDRPRPRREASRSLAGARSLRRPPRVPEPLSGGAGGRQGHARTAPSSRASR